MACLLTGLEVNRKLIHELSSLHSSIDSIWRSFLKDKSQFYVDSKSDHEIILTNVGDIFFTQSKKLYGDTYSTQPPTATIDFIKLAVIQVCHHVNTLESTSGDISRTISVMSSALETLTAGTSALKVFDDLVDCMVILLEEFLAFTTTLLLKDSVGSLDTERFSTIRNISTLFFKAVVRHTKAYVNRKKLYISCTERILPTTLLLFESITTLSGQSFVNIQHSEQVRFLKSVEEFIDAALFDDVKNLEEISTLFCSQGRGKMDTIGKVDHENGKRKRPKDSKLAQTISPVAHKSSYYISFFDAMNEVSRSVRHSASPVYRSLEDHSENRLASTSCRCFAWIFSIFAESSLKLTQHREGGDTVATGSTASHSQEGDASAAWRKHCSRLLHVCFQIIQSIEEPWTATPENAAHSFVLVWQLQSRNHLLASLHSKMPGSIPRHPSLIGHSWHLYILAHHAVESIVKLSSGDGGSAPLAVAAATLGKPQAHFPAFRNETVAAQLNCISTILLIDHRPALGLLEDPALAQANEPGMQKKRVRRNGSGQADDSTAPAEELPSGGVKVEDTKDELGIGNAKHRAHLMQALACPGSHTSRLSDHGSESMGVDAVSLEAARKRLLLGLIDTFVDLRRLDMLIATILSLPNHDQELGATGELNQLLASAAVQSKLSTALAALPSSQLVAVWAALCASTPVDGGTATLGEDVSRRTTDVVDEGSASMGVVDNEQDREQGGGTGEEGRKCVSTSACLGASAVPMLRAVTAAALHSSMSSATAALPLHHILGVMKQVLQSLIVNGEQMSENGLTRSCTAVSCLAQLLAVNVFKAHGSYRSHTYTSDKTDGLQEWVRLVESAQAIFNSLDSTADSEEWRLSADTVLALSWARMTLLTFFFNAHAAGIDLGVDEEALSASVGQVISRALALKELTGGSQRSRSQAQLQLLVFVLQCVPQWEDAGVEIPSDQLADLSFVTLNNAAQWMASPESPSSCPGCIGDLFVQLNTVASVDCESVGSSLLVAVNRLLQFSTAHLQARTAPEPPADTKQSSTAKTAKKGKKKSAAADKACVGPTAVSGDFSGHMTEILAILPVRALLESAMGVRGTGMDAGLVQLTGIAESAVTIINLALNLVKNGVVSKSNSPMASAAGGSIADIFSVVESASTFLGQYFSVRSAAEGGALTDLSEKILAELLSIFGSALEVLAVNGVPLTRTIRFVEFLLDCGWSQLERSTSLSLSNGALSSAFLCMADCVVAVAQHVGDEVSIVGRGDGSVSRESSVDDRQISKVLILNLVRRLANCCSSARCLTIGTRGDSAVSEGSIGTIVAALVPKFRGLVIYLQQQLSACSRELSVHPLGSTEISVRAPTFQPGLHGKGQSQSAARFSFALGMNSILLADCYRAVVACESALGVSGVVVGTEESDGMVASEESERKATILELPPRLAALCSGKFMQYTAAHETAQLTAIDVRGWMYCLGTVLLLQESRGYRPRPALFAALLTDVSTAIHLLAQAHKLQHLAQFHSTFDLVWNEESCVSVCLRGLLAAAPPHAGARICEMCLQLVSSVQVSYSTVAAQTKMALFATVAAECLLVEHGGQLNAIFISTAGAILEAVANVSDRSERTVTETLGSCGDSTTVSSLGPSQGLVHRHQTVIFSDRPPGAFQSVVRVVSVGFRVIESLVRHGTGSRRVAQANGTAEGEVVSNPLSYWSMCSMRVLSRVLGHLPEIADEASRGLTDAILTAFETILSQQKSVTLSSSVGLVSSLLRQCVAVVTRCETTGTRPHSTSSGRTDGAALQQQDATYSGHLQALARLLSSAAANNELNKHAHLLAASVLDLLAHQMLSGPTIELLSPGLFALFDKCRQKQKKQLFSLLDGGAKALFDDLHASYLRDFKFTGKA